MQPLSHHGRVGGDRTLVAGAPGDRRLRIVSSLQRNSLSESRDVWAEWLHNFAAWSLAATITLRRNLHGQAVNLDISEAALRHMLRVLDVSCYGKSGVKQGKAVPSAVVIDWGAYGDHPHAHVALATPAGLSYQELADHFEKAASRTQWIHHERVAVPYRDSGWAAYLVDHDPENLVLSLLRAG